MIIFKTEFKIEFLLPVTGTRIVLGIMPAVVQWQI